MALIEVFETYPLAFLVFTFILGLTVGSFLNVVIYRLPIMMEGEWTAQCKELLGIASEDAESKTASTTFNLSKPGSHCPKCNHSISALENIPVLSYLFLQGKCKECKTRISPRYPAIELISGILTCAIATKFGVNWVTVALFVLAWSLLTLTMIDIDQQLLPDDITLPLLWLGLLVNSQGWLVSLESAFWGAVGGYLILWTIYWVFKLLTGKEGMGYGDFKLLAALGAWMGWQVLPQIILVSSLVGAIVGISMIVLRGKDKNIPIPFGPYLASAGFIALLWSEQVNGIYSALFM